MVKPCGRTSAKTGVSPALAPGLQLGSRDRRAERKHSVADERDPLSPQEGRKFLFEALVERTLVREDAIGPDLFEKRHQFLQVRQERPRHVNHLSQREIPRRTFLRT